MLKLLFISILLYHIVKCDINPLELDYCLRIPGVDIMKFNSNQDKIKYLDKIDYVSKLNTDFDAEGVSKSVEVIFEITEDKEGLQKKRLLKQQLKFLKNIYKYFNLTETNEETIKPDDSFKTVLTKLQNDVDVKLNYVQPILKKLCGIHDVIPDELTPYLRKLMMDKLINDTSINLEKKLKVFETNDCELQEHVLPNIIEFFKTSDKKEWMRITLSLKVYIEQCLKNPEDIQKIKSKIPSSSIKNLIFGDTVCLRNVETNGYLKSINIHNMSASIEKKINYSSKSNTFTIQNPNGKYMQFLENRNENIVASHYDFDSKRAFWEVKPTDGDYVNFLNMYSFHYLNVNENHNAIVLYTSKPEKFQWQVEVNCKDGDID